MTCITTPYNKILRPVREWLCQDIFRYSFHFNIFPGHPASLEALLGCLTQCSCIVGPSMVGSIARLCTAAVVSSFVVKWWTGWVSSSDKTACLFYMTLNPLGVYLEHTCTCLQHALTLLKAKLALKVCSNRSELSVVILKIKVIVWIISSSTKYIKWTCAYASRCCLPCPCVGVRWLGGDAGQAGGEATGAGGQSTQVTNPSEVSIISSTASPLLFMPSCHR